MVLVDNDSDADSDNGSDNEILLAEHILGYSDFLI
jgi:hypothetical protein